MKNPIEVLFGAIQYGVMVGNICKKAPGSVIKKLSDESRQILSNLKSDDVRKIRVESWEIGDVEYMERKKMSEEKLEFDKKFKRWTDYLKNDKT